jgi:hypothetical protein
MQRRWGGSPLHAVSLPFKTRIVRSLSENKVSNRQIVRVSDFEIKVVVDDQSDFVTESLDC